jgi:hypothetical protein
MKTQKQKENIMQYNDSSILHDIHFIKVSLILQIHYLEQEI